MKRYLPLLAILALLGALLVQAVGASAASHARANAVASDPGHPFEAADEEGEEEFEEDEMELEECEAEDFGFEFDEEGEEEELTAAEEEELEEECGGAGQKGKDSPFITAPAACKVSRAESRIVASPATGQVQLTVRYRTWAPTPVAVSLKLLDRKGTVGLDRTTQHLTDHGVLRLTTKVGKAMMDRALKASGFDVSLVAPKTPAFCADALEQQLHGAGHASATSRRVYSS